MQLDHLAWATPSLDEAIAEVERLSGVRAAPGGSHPGMGTRNALLSLGPDLYLALDGPDPGQPQVDNNGARMAALASPVMAVFVIATTAIEEKKAVLDRLGFAPTLKRLNRKRHNGAEIEWLALEAQRHPFGMAMPVITQWITTDHPSADAPGGCRLADFTVHHPDAKALSGVYHALGVTILVTSAQATRLAASFTGPKGPFSLS